MKSNSYEKGVKYGKSQYFLFCQDYKMLTCSIKERFQLFYKKFQKKKEYKRLKETMDNFPKFLKGLEEGFSN